MDAMFKFDDEMFEDDWCDGDYVNVSHHAQAHGNEFDANISVKERDGDSHEVEVTTGAKFNMPWANGIKS
jgi:hypothetical protein